MFSAPWWVLVALVLMMGLVATVFLLRRDAKDPSRRHNPALLFVGRFLALVYVGLGFLGTIIGTVGTIVNNSVQVALPVQQFWPDTYPWITLDPAPAASVVGGGFTTADVLVDGLV